MRPQEAAEFAFCLRGARFRWPGQERDILDIPFFSAGPGERIFISGPSGSGKSTLLSLIAGILCPSAGEVSVNGRCLSALTGAERDIFRGEHIGFIFQQFNLIPYLSILDNVLLPCRFSPERRGKAEKQAGSAPLAAQNLLEQLDLPSPLWKRQVTRLSVGQQQRVAAARALIGGPAMIMADEPTSSLDADHRKVFLRLLLEECRAAGSTLLFVSHDHSLAEEFSVTVKLAELNRAACPEENRGAP
ncbi:MAG: ABC transporter ATP-binding protein [Deltaproteobacteria bacterium]|jgi:putative ABC transport system ATP-binding protein|nr:ABC transporter ATP-binding protein [Deltaproteobacteria bacterium]